MLFQLQALLVGLSSILVYLSTSHRTEKRELLALHQMMNWSIAGFSMVLPLFSATGLLSRLTSIYFGFAPPFLLLSIGYENETKPTKRGFQLTHGYLQNPFIISSKRIISMILGGLSSSVV